MTLDCSYQGLPDVSPEVKEGPTCVNIHIHKNIYIKNIYMVFLKQPSPSERVGRERNGCLDMDCWD